MKKLKLFGYLFSLSLLVASFWLFFNRQEILDWWRLRDYEPSSDIVRLATDSSFSDYGRRLFYVHYPELLDKPNFEGKCSVTEETIVLGCYITHSKIYVFDVEDDRLEGVEEVTAAHEMLHAAYDRLADDERRRIGALLKDFFATVTDERLIKTVDSYTERDPAIVTNELHSIVGTEVRELPTELEDYYSQYFLDRLAIVSQAEGYSQEFITLEEQIEAYDEQLKNIETEIEALESDIAQLNQALNTEKARLQSLRNDPEAYNLAVPGFNEQVRAYNEQVQALRAKIESYNAIVAERNLIALEERELVEAIDTRILETE